MDEYVLLDEYREWINKSNPPVFQAAWKAWLEATRRADRKARFECAQICADYLPFSEAGKIVHAILTTIPNEE